MMKEKRVSVPCRGTTFLNSIPVHYKRDVVGFRPLSGNYISQSEPDISSTMTILSTFPSPVGELHFSIIFCIYYKIGGGTSFRPLSGNYISQLGRYYQRQKSPYKCFRPLSGNYISQSVSCDEMEQILFPSPVGELHFSIRTEHLCESGHQTVSVPCRGTTFLNNSKKTVLISCRCFRPLSGNYISQSGNHSWWQGKIYSVSVPCRGTTFLNLTLQWLRQISEVRFRLLSGNYISQ